jgi:hypothetical protein
MLDTPCSEVVWRVLATHSIRQFPLHFPSRASPCAIIFQLESTFRCATTASWKRPHAMYDYFYFSVDATQNVLQLESVVNIPRKNKSFNSTRLLLFIITTKLKLLVSVVIGVWKWTNFLLTCQRFIFRRYREPARENVTSSRAHRTGSRRSQPW